MKCRGGETGGGGGGLLKRGGGRGEPRPMAKCCDQFGSNLQSAIETRVRAGHKAGTQLYNLQTGRANRCRASPAGYANGYFPTQRYHDQIKRTLRSVDLFFFSLDNYNTWKPQSKEIKVIRKKIYDHIRDHFVTCCGHAYNRKISFHMECALTHLPHRVKQYLEKANAVSDRQNNGQRLMQTRIFSYTSMTRTTIWHLLIHACKQNLQTQCRPPRQIKNVSL